MAAPVCTGCGSLWVWPFGHNGHTYIVWPDGRRCTGRILMVCCRDRIDAHGLSGAEKSHDWPPDASVRVRGMCGAKGAGHASKRDGVRRMENKVRTGWKDRPLPLEKGHDSVCSQARRKRRKTDQKTVSDIGRYSLLFRISNLNTQETETISGGCPGTHGGDHIMEKLLTARQVAELIGNRSSKWVYKLAGEGRIPSVRLTDGTLRFIPGEIEKWIESKKTDQES